MTETRRLRGDEEIRPLDLSMMWDVPVDQGQILPLSIVAGPVPSRRCMSPPSTATVPLCARGSTAEMRLGASSLRTASCELSTTPIGGSQYCGASWPAWRHVFVGFRYRVAAFITGKALLAPRRESGVSTRSPRRPSRIRMASATSDTKIMPSPGFPVRQRPWMIPTRRSSW